MHRFGFPGSVQLQEELTARLLPQEDVTWATGHPEKSLGAVESGPESSLAEIVEALGMKGARFFEDDGSDGIHRDQKMT